eukprot:tig00000385_g24731.t1
MPLEFFFPQVFSKTIQATLLVDVVNNNGGKSTTAAAGSVKVAPELDSTGNPRSDFESAVANFIRRITNKAERRKTTFKKWMRSVEASLRGLESLYGAAAGIAVSASSSRPVSPARRFLQQPAVNSTLVNLLSGAMTSAMSTVVEEASAAEVDLADPETAGAVVGFFSSVAPIAAKTGAVSPSAAKSGAELLMTVLSKNPNLATTPGVSSSDLQAALAGLLSALPATSAEAAAVRAQTSAALSKISTQITLKSGSCGAQTRSSDVEPIRFKVCAGTASSRQLIYNSVTIAMPENAHSSDYQAAIVPLAASGFPTPQTGFSLASDVYDISATSLDASGNVVDLKTFAANITFSLPKKSGVTVAATQRVTLAFYNADTKLWDTSCGAASASAAGTAGVYTGSCNHLTPFALLSSTPASTGSGSSSVAFAPLGLGLHIAVSGFLSLLLAIAALAPNRY